MPPDERARRAGSGIGPPSLGRRVVVIGAAGSGKSTFSRALSAKTGLRVIHLDLHRWKPGWVRRPEAEYRKAQQALLADDAWIIDGSDAIALAFEGADTLVLLDTPWWTCAWRAFLRGLRRPHGFEPPEGCEDSAWRRMRDEWSLVWLIWRGRHEARERALAIASRYRGTKTVHVLRTRRAARELINRVASGEMPEA